MSCDSDVENKWKLYYTVLFAEFPMLTFRVPWSTKFPVSFFTSTLFSGDPVAALGKKPFKIMDSSIQTAGCAKAHKLNLSVVLLPRELVLDDSPIIIIKM